MGAVVARFLVRPHVLLTTPAAPSCTGLEETVEAEGGGEGKGEGEGGKEGDRGGEGKAGLGLKPLPEEAEAEKQETLLQRFWEAVLRFANNEEIGQLHLITRYVVSNVQNAAASWSPSRSCGSLILLAHHLCPLFAGLTRWGWSARCHQWSCTLARCVCYGSVPSVRFAWLPYLYTAPDTICCA